MNELYYKALKIIIGKIDKVVVKPNTKETTVYLTNGKKLYDKGSDIIPDFILAELVANSLSIEERKELVVEVKKCAAKKN